MNRENIIVMRLGNNLYGVAKIQKFKSEKIIFRKMYICIIS